MVSPIQCLMSNVGKGFDPKEGVEYITGKDGNKRPMSWYKAQAEQAKKENPVQEPTILDALFNWP